MAGYGQAQPNFFMNTIVYDVHLYTRMLYLQRKGNLEGAAVLRELLTNKIEDIQEAVHPQVLARNASPTGATTTTSSSSKTSLQISCSAYGARDQTC